MVRWTRALASGPVPAELSWAKLAPEYEAFVGRVRPASPDHRLRSARLPQGETAKSHAKHLATGSLLRAAPLGRCRSLLPSGWRLCVGLSTHPFFVGRHEVMLQLPHPATRCRDT